MKETDSAEKSEKVTCAARPTRELPWPCQRSLGRKGTARGEAPKDDGPLVDYFVASHGETQRCGELLLLMLLFPALE